MGPGKMYPNTLIFSHSMFYTFLSIFLRNVRLDLWLHDVNPERSPPRVIDFKDLFRGGHFFPKIKLGNILTRPGNHGKGNYTRFLVILCHCHLRVLLALLQEKGQIKVDSHQHRAVYQQRTSFMAESTVPTEQK